MGRGVRSVAAALLCGVGDECAAVGAGAPTIDVIGHPATEGWAVDSVEVRHETVDYCGTATDVKGHRLADAVGRAGDDGPLAVRPFQILAAAQQRLVEDEEQRREPAAGIKKLS